MLAAMSPQPVSRTAVGAAGHRAAHQALEGGRVFADPLAIPILGPDAHEAIASARAEPERRGLRLFIAMRSRFAEDCAFRAIDEGTRQILVIGAGLDTFALRLEPRDGLRVFELDRPASQRDKRARLAEARIAEPAHLAFVAHDLEQDLELGLAQGAMMAALAAAGFDPRARTFALWLGVVPYLTDEAVFATLGALGGLPGGAEVVFDYANPSPTIDDAPAREAHDELAAHVAARGEPFRSFFDTQDLHARARTLGFVDIEDLDRAALVSRFLPTLPAKPRPGPGGHVVRMATRAAASCGAD